MVSTLAEWWNNSVGVGPRFEVGVRFGGPLAFVLAEGARFGVGILFTGARARFAVGARLWGAVL